MKKLMVVLGAMVIAAVTQASQFNWSVQTTYDGYQIDKTYGGDAEAWGNNADYAKGFTVYLIDAALCDGETFLQKWRDGSSASSLASQYGVGITSGTTSGDLGTNGKLPAAIAIDSTKTDFSAFVVFEADNGNYLFESAVTAFNHNDQVPPTVAVKTSNASMVFSDSYVSTGSYYAAVPEPTSGLLLLLGVAGLALKRKRA